MRQVQDLDPQLDKGNGRATQCACHPVSLGRAPAPWGQGGIAVSLTEGVTGGIHLVVSEAGRPMTPTPRRGYDRGGRPAANDGVPVPEYWMPPIGIGRPPR